MDIDVSYTFQKTYEVYHEAKNQFEIDHSKNIDVEPEYRYTQIVSMGGSRSSKTYSILQLLLLEMVSRTNLKITVWRATKVNCRATVMEDFKNIIMFDYKIFKDIRENKQAGSFTYVPTGSKIIFEGADSPGKVHGLTQDISFFNEVTEFRKDVYLQITQRTAERVFCDYNPSKNFWLETYRQNSETIFIHSNFENNAFCPPNIVKRLRSYEPWETGSYEFDGFRCLYNGKPIAVGNEPPPNSDNIAQGTADVWHWLVYGLGVGSEKPNKIYKGWIPITQEHFDGIDLTSYFGMDFGASNPTACMEVKYDGDGAFYITERMYTPLQDIADSLPTAVKLRVPNIIHGESILVGDSAKQSYLDLLLNEGYMAIGATKGSGSVEVGITLVQGFTIYYVPSDNLSFEYDNYSWEIDKNGKSIDSPLKADDHLMDALRYIISYLVGYLSIKV